LLGSWAAEVSHFRISGMLTSTAAPRRTRNV
jgi:hypothetical protein